MKKNKFKPFVYLFIVAVILIAFITNPGYDAFMKYYRKQPTTQSGPPVIGFKNNYIYSVFNVDYLKPMDVPSGDDGNTKTVAVPALQEKYIGLFGWFWKM